MGDNEGRLEIDFVKTLDDLSDELTRNYIRRLVNLFTKIKPAEAEEIRLDAQPADRFFCNLKANKDLSSRNVDLLIENLEFIQLIKAAGILRRYKQRNVNLINSEIERLQREKQQISSSSVNPTPSSQGQQPADGIQNKIFISFSFKTKDKVIELKKKIEEAVGDGSCWICITNVDPGDNLDGEITAAINKASVMLCMINKHYIDSKECEMEFLLARQLKKNIILIHLENVETPYKKSNGECSKMQLAAAQQLYVTLYGENKEDELNKLVTKVKECISGRCDNGEPSEGQSPSGHRKRKIGAGGDGGAKKTKKE